MAYTNADLSFTTEKLIDTYKQDIFNKVHTLLPVSCHPCFSLLTLLITGFIFDLKAVISHCFLSKSSCLKTASFYVPCIGSAHCDFLFYRAPYKYSYLLTLLTYLQMV